MIGPEQPVAHAAALNIKSDPFALCVRSGSGVVGHAGTDRGNESYAVVLNESAVRGIFVAQALDCLRFWATGCGVAEEAIVAVAAEVDNARVRY